jgi:ferritin-like metal-binding protein YciE
VYEIEQQGLQLLSTAGELAGDEQIAEVYRRHSLETKEHTRAVAERIAAHGADNSPSDHSGSGVAAIELRVAPEPTPAVLAVAVYAFENLEIAAYHLLRGMADRAGDPETVAAADRILEQEEAAAEVLASTFDRTLELSIGA